MSTAQLRVAIADDDRSMREVLTQMLRNLGHEVVAIAENGRSLIEQCATAHPDVVITDNLMPDMRGVDVAAEIYSCQGTPVILLSGYCDREVVLDAEQSHVLLYLVKPISEPILEVALSGCRSRAEQHSDGDDTRSEQVEVLVSAVRAREDAPAQSRFTPPYRQIRRRPR